MGAADDHPTVDLGPRSPSGQYPTVADPDEFGDADDTATAAPRDSVHALPTQQLPLRGKRPTGGTTSLTKMSGSGSTASPLEAMRHDEFERSRIFVRVQDALNEIWGVRPKRGRALGQRAKRMVQKRVGSFLLAMLVGVLLFVSMGLKSVIAGVHELTGELPFGSTAPRVVEAVSSIVLVAAFLGAMFRWLPDVELGWRDVWPGALLTSVLAAAGAFVISAYLGYFATTSVSGAVGGVFVLLLWIYWNAQVFLLGAEFTRAYTLRRRGEVEPEPHAELVTH